MFDVINLFSQDQWILKKESNGIKVYTSQPEGQPIMKYRVVTSIQSNYKDVYKQVVDFEGNKKNLETVKELRILKNLPEKEFITYMIIDLPWPLQNRDLLTKMQVNKHDLGYHLISKSVNTPEINTKHTVRIENFYEEWQISKKNAEFTNVEIIGWADPGGLIPLWVVNMYVVEEPYRFMNGLKSYLETN